MGKKSVVCVFAHPDDEAFWPSGTVYKLSKDNDVYILCATKGDAGKDSRLKKDKVLTEQRSEELKNAAKILGVKKVFFLGFKDGCLCNNLYHELASKIEKHLRVIEPHIVITFEHKGVSGHIDHVAVSMATTFVSQKLKFIKEIWYYCATNNESKFWKKYFIYFPPGYKKSEIDKTVDISDVWDIKCKAIHQHKSQKHDAKHFFSYSEKLPKEEHFLVTRL